MSYVDGFVLAMSKRKVPAYRRMAKRAGKVWREHGALDFKECMGDDLFIKGVKTFPSAVKLMPGETVFFSFIVYKSRAHRDRVNAKVMKDPRLKKMMGEAMPFDPRRMLYGGFKVVVQG